MNFRIVQSPILLVCSDEKDLKWCLTSQAKPFYKYHRVVESLIFSSCVMQVDLEKHLGEDSLSADIVTCLAHLQVRLSQYQFSPGISIDVLVLLQCI